MSYPNSHIFKIFEAKYWERKNREINKMLRKRKKEGESYGKEERKKKRKEKWKVKWKREKIYLFNE